MTTPSVLERRPTVEPRNDHNGGWPFSDETLARLAEADVPKPVAVAAETALKLREMHKARRAERVRLLDVLDQARRDDAAALVAAAAAGKAAPASKLAIAAGLLADHEAEGPAWSPAFTIADSAVIDACVAHADELAHVLDPGEWSTLAARTRRARPNVDGPIPGVNATSMWSILDAQALGRDIGRATGEGRGSIDASIAQLRLDSLYATQGEQYWAEVRRVAHACA